MSQRRERAVSHSLSCTALEWELIRDLADDAGTSMSRFIVDRVFGRDGSGGDVRARTFIVRVAEDAMAPRVRAGDYVWVDPDEPASDGRFVAVRDPARTVDVGNETDIRGVVVFVGNTVCAHHHCGPACFAHRRRGCMLRAANPGGPAWRQRAPTRRCSAPWRRSSGGRSEAPRPVTTAAAAGSGRRRLPRHVARWPGKHAGPDASSGQGSLF